MNKNEQATIQERLSLERTIMANHRTFLSFMRTALYFLVAGLSIRSLLGLQEDHLIHLSLYGVSLVLFIVGIVLFIRYRKKCKRIDEFLSQVNPDDKEKPKAPRFTDGDD